MRLRSVHIHEKCISILSTLDLFLGVQMQHTREMVLEVSLQEDMEPAASKAQVRLKVH